MNDTPTTKPWWKSRTIWLNVVATLLEVTQLVSGTTWVPPGTIAIVTNLLNIVLRKLTTQPLGNPPPAAP